MDSAFGEPDPDLTSRTPAELAFALKLEQATVPKTLRSGNQVGAVDLEDPEPAQPVDLVSSGSDSDEQQQDNSRFFPPPLPEYVAPQPSLPLGPDGEEQSLFCLNFSGNDMTVGEVGEQHAIFCASEESMFMRDFKGSGADLAKMMVKMKPKWYARSRGNFYDMRRVQAPIPEEFLEEPAPKKLQEDLQQMLNAPNHKLWSPNLISNQEGVLPQQMHRDYSPEELKEHEDTGGMPFVVIYAPTEGCSILIKYPDVNEMVKVNIPAQHVLVFQGGQAHAGCDSQPRIHFYFAKEEIDTDANEFIGKYELTTYYCKGKKGEGIFNGDPGDY